MTLYIAVVGTSDQSCWLAEACKVLLLLPLVSHYNLLYQGRDNICWYLVRHPLSVPHLA